MDKQAEICETYQLKWNSFGSYMHSCISSSLYSDSFADVALVTADGHQVMAHRYVLSYSSLFLAQVLKLHRKVTTALPLMIVLPPEIDYKSLKVLVRYMYSGEAKVAKEILKNVLRGGDILQIKGLYREKEDADKNVKITQQPPKPVPTPPPTPALPPMIPITKAASKPTQNITQTPTTSTEKPTKPTQKPAPKFLVLQKQKEQITYTNARQKAKVLNFTLMQNFEKNTQSNEASDKRSKHDEPEPEEGIVKTEPGIIRPEQTNNLQYLMIKDEPIEWCETDMELIESKDDYEEINVKTEEQDNRSSSEEEDEELFSPLTCELCTETFTIPREWVRHVQTHTDMLPAKRRRRDSTGDSYENDTFPELMCDLCQKPFPTPSEWVKHIQKTHTEFELHLSNKTGRSSTTTSKYTAVTTSAVTPATQAADLHKQCTACNKVFPSHASMVIHKRSHTGEKPFNCDTCNKTFNVKSNLLRHLRTIHNKIINSADIDNKDDDTSN